MFRNVPERSGTQRGAFVRNLRTEGLDSECKNVVTLPETLPDTLFWQTPGFPGEKGRTAECDPPSVPPAGLPFPPSRLAPSSRRSWRRRLQQIGRASCRERG